MVLNKQNIHALILWIFKASGEKKQKKHSQLQFSHDEWLRGASWMNDIIIQCHYSAFHRKRGHSSGQTNLLSPLPQSFTSTSHWLTDKSAFPKQAFLFLFCCYRCHPQDLFLPTVDRNAICSYVSYRTTSFCSISVQFVRIRMKS